eukprot:245144-Chlamydomonas_euryale.AAC.1
MNSGPPRRRRHRSSTACLPAWLATCPTNLPTCRLSMSVRRPASSMKTFCEWRSHWLVSRSSIAARTTVEPSRRSFSSTSVVSSTNCLPRGGTFGVAEMGEKAFQRHQRRVVNKLPVRAAGGTGGRSGEGGKGTLTRAGRRMAREIRGYP